MDRACVCVCVCDLCREMVRLNCMHVHRIFEVSTWSRKRDVELRIWPWNECWNGGWNDGKWNKWNGYCINLGLSHSSSFSIVDTLPITIVEGAHPFHVPENNFSSAAHVHQNEEINRLEWFFRDNRLDSRQQETHGKRSPLFLNIYNHICIHLRE